jgi:fatty acid desaturase
LWVNLERLAKNFYLTYMNAQRKKYVAPVIVTVFIALYYLIATTLFYDYNDFPFMVKIAIFVVPSIIIIVMMVMVLFERFKEIKKGEEDDLSQY